MAAIAQPPGLGPAGRPDSIASRLLLPASWVYGAAALARRRWWSRRSTRLERPVLSVGNITCGGTGKTPAVEMLVRDLLRLGRKPAILSRGYGPSLGEGGLTDEYLVLAANVPEAPHHLGKDRVASGRRAIEAGADVLVLDDGFHYRRLSRDLDIVLIDAILPFGHGRVLPSGLLREPLEALADADLFGITRSNLVRPEELASVESALEARFPGTPRLLLETEAVECRTLGGTALPPEALRGRRVFAFSGIGNPEAFARLLLRLGAKVARLAPFRDHHRYSEADLREIASRAREAGAEAVVCTQKDAVKLSRAPGSWLYVRVAQRVARGAEDYRAALARALAEGEKSGQTQD
ncbi:MAG: tetraacyldisaccharide 4'-kinase [Planctomycetota bacterium]